MQGRCTCGAVAFRLTGRPIITHCCHCTWCQRETGSAFALNAVVPQPDVEVMRGVPEAVALPSASGGGQQVMRCPDCKVALWSHYSSQALAYVRVGVLEERAEVVPDVHIYTTTKLPWVVIPEGAAVYEAFYSPKEVWSAEDRARFRAAQAALGD